MRAITLSVRKIGNSLGIILTKEAALLLRVDEHSKLAVTQSPDGLRLTPYDPEFEKKLEVAESVMSRYKNALKELAK